MKERGIIFSAPMVRAILAGRKTQTRREIVNPDRFSNVRECAYLAPYGVPGDRLWVRETQWRNGGYVATQEASIPHDGKRPAIHMRRSDSRLTLAISEVRVQRCGEITDEDAKAEGMVFHDGRPSGHHGWRHDPDYGFVEGTPRGAFFALWRLINGDGSLKSNPWVWAISFQVVK